VAILNWKEQLNAVLNGNITINQPRDLHNGILNIKNNNKDDSGDKNTLYEENIKLQE